MRAWKLVNIGSDNGLAPVRTIVNLLSSIHFPGLLNNGHFGALFERIDCDLTNPPIIKRLASCMMVNE